MFNSDFRFIQSPIIKKITENLNKYFECSVYGSSKKNCLEMNEIEKISRAGPKGNYFTLMAYNSYISFTNKKVFYTKNLVLLVSLYGSYMKKSFRYEDFDI